MDQSEIINFWDTRADSNIASDSLALQDQYQRKLEIDFILPELNKELEVLEVGCGNGVVTKILSELVKHVDAFDASKKMLERVEKNFIGDNCNFFVKSLPAPDEDGLKKEYDLALSNRVIINLADEQAQQEAIGWIASKLKKGGTYILIEGAREGANKLDEVRTASGMSPIARAKYNLDLTKETLERSISPYFTIEKRENIGLYDFLTRFFYPLLNGEKNIQYNTEFHNAAYKASKVIEKSASFNEYSRLYMLLLKKK